MKRNSSICLLEAGNNTTNSPKISMSFDYVSELINNRQTDQLKSCLQNSFKDINLKNDDSLLMKACKVGDMESVKLLIVHGADVSFVSYYSGYTALTLACLCGHESIVNLLLQHGAVINPATGYLPLVEACKVGHIGIVEILLNSGARVDDQPQMLCDDKYCYANDDDNVPHNHGDLSALMVASSNGYTAIVSLLLKHGATVELELESLRGDKFSLLGYTALTFASSHYHWDVVKLFVAGGADINRVSSDGEFIVNYHPSPLMHACEEGDVGTVNDLLEMGADINAAIWARPLEYSFNSPLISASAHGHLDLVKLLLAHDQFTARGTISYALVGAYKHDHADIVEALRSHVGDLNSFDIGVTCRVETPLSIAIASEHRALDCVRLLLEMGADVNAPTNGQGQSPLMTSCKVGSIEVTEFLLQHGASVDAYNKRGETVMTYVFCKKPSDIMMPLLNLLIEHGADVNAIDRDGNTVLMHAVTYYCHKLDSPTVKVLLDYGLDVTVQNRFRDSVFDLLAKANISTGLRDEFIALCKQYKESNRRANATTAPVLK